MSATAGSGGGGDGTGPDEPTHVSGHAGEDLSGGGLRAHRDDDQTSARSQVPDRMRESIGAAVPGQGVDGRDRARGLVSLPDRSFVEVNLAVTHAGFVGSVGGQDLTVQTDLVHGPEPVVGPGEPVSDDDILRRGDGGGRPDLAGPRFDPGQAVLGGHPDLPLPERHPPLVGQREPLHHLPALRVYPHDLARAANPDRTGRHDELFGAV
jgi:hypothetical protein